MNQVNARIVGVGVFDVVSGLLVAAGLALSSPVVTGVGGAAGVSAVKQPPVCGPICPGGKIGPGGRR